MSSNQKKLQDMDLVLYIYDEDSKRVKNDAIAVFVYSDKQTNIYAKPGSKLESGLNEYSEKVRTGETNHNAWQQFNYLTRGAFQANSEAAELTDEEQSTVTKILQSWGELE